METMSLPTKVTMRSRVGVEALEGASGGGGSQGEGVVLAVGRERGRGGQARGDVGEVARARARRNALDVDARRAEARALVYRRVVHRRPQRLGGVARADEDRPRPGQALARGGQEALGLAA